jgi:retinoid hydroxylase
MGDRLKSADMMPGSFGLPFIGQTIGILAKQELFYWQQYQQYGNIFKISLPEAIGFGKCACLIGPEANQLVLKDYHPGWGIDR